MNVSAMRNSIGYTLNTFMTSSPRWLMTFTAMRPASACRTAAMCRCEGSPMLRVDLGLQRGLQRAVGVVRAEEVGVADEEALLVVVGVDEPAGDAVGAVADDLAGLGLNTSTPLTFTRSLPSFSSSSVMSGSPKMTKRLPLPVFFRSSAMCRSAFMRALSTGMRPSLVNSVVCAS